MKEMNSSTMRHYLSASWIEALAETHLIVKGREKVPIAVLMPIDEYEGLRKAVDPGYMSVKLTEAERDLMQMHGIGKEFIDETEEIWKVAGTEHD
jgi:hypothetical protein